MYKINHASIDDDFKSLVIDCTDAQGGQVSVNINMTAALAAGIVACEPMVPIEAAVEIALSITDVEIEP